MRYHAVSTRIRDGHQCEIYGRSLAVIEKWAQEEATLGHHTKIFIVEEREIKAYEPTR